MLNKILESQKLGVYSHDKLIKLSATALEPSFLAMIGRQGRGGGKKVESAIICHRKGMGVLPWENLGTWPKEVQTPPVGALLPSTEEEQWTLKAKILPEM